ncbi:MAG: hypothetical protein K8S98_03575 [Planctomycetes bacterium]|nr:hypothetical protein [Planctomycetota bacterium]
MSRFAAPACVRVRERLDRLLDRALTPVDEARDRGHLEACAACARELEARRRWWSAFRELDLPSEVEFAELTRGLGARLERARAPRAKSAQAGMLRRVGAVALAAAALVALAVFGAWSGARPIEELFAAAPRPALSLGAFELPSFEALEPWRRP